MAIAAEEVAHAGVRNITNRSRSRSNVAAGDQRPNAGSGDSARQRAASPGIFAVFIIAGIIALLSIVQYGTVKEGTFLALLVFLVLGSIAPPIAIVIGVIIVFAIMIRGAGVKLFSWLGQIPNRTQPAQASLPNPVGTIAGYNSSGQPISA